MTSLEISRHFTEFEGGQGLRVQNSLWLHKGRASASGRFSWNALANETAMLYQNVWNAFKVLSNARAPINGLYQFLGLKLIKWRIYGHQMT